MRTGYHEGMRLFASGFTDSASNSCRDFNGKTTTTLSPRGLPCFEGLSVI